MNAMDAVIKARSALLRDQPFFGSLLLYLEPVMRKPEEMTIPTMATDGTHLFYCEDFVMSLPGDQLQTVMIHEVCHIALCHLSRVGGRTPMRWNWAADFAANDLIASTTDSNGRKIFTPLPGWLLNAAWHDESAEQIYTKLPAPQPGGGQGKYPGPTMDDHTQWKDFAKDQSVEAKEQDWKDRVAKASVEARSRGKMPGGWQTVVDNFLEPKMSWKQIIQDTVVSLAKNDYRLFPPNKKHIWRGIYLPSLRGEEINIAFDIDVSGSISDEEIHEALSEVKGICDQFTDYTIFLRAFDTKIQNRWELHPFDPVPTVVNGRGGTDFQEALDEIPNLPGISSMIIMSDLEAPFPKEPVTGVPIIWLSITDKKAPWGMTIPYPRKG